jgi:hypothetical protein
MFRKLISATLAVVIVASVNIAPKAKADEYQRVILSGTTSAAYTNSASFYNAKILAVRAQNLAGAACTNAIVFSQVDSTGVLTNTLTTITTATSGATDLSTNGYVQLKGDVFRISATSNFLAEIVFDNRSR